MKSNQCFRPYCAVDILRLSYVMLHWERKYVFIFWEPYKRRKGILQTECRIMFRNFRRFAGHASQYIYLSN